MPEYSNWGQLVGAVQKVSKTVLENDVAPITERMLSEHIQSDIYDVYTPKEGAWINGSTYKRRNLLQKNIKSFLENSNELLTTSTALPSPPIVKGSRLRNTERGSFLRLLSSNDIGIWKSGFPRPAVDYTQRDIDKSLKNGELRRAIQNGLNRELQ